MMSISSEAMEREVRRVGEQGVLYSWTIMHDAPDGFTQFLPYAVALIKTDIGMLVTARLTEVSIVGGVIVDSYGDEVKIGTKLEMVTRILSKHGDEGLVRYGYNYRPILRKLN